MRGRILEAALVSVLVLGAAGAHADDAPGVVRTHVERPPEDSMRRGSIDAPAWVVYTGAGTLAAIAAAVLAWRMARRR